MNIIIFLDFNKYLIQKFYHLLQKLLNLIFKYI